jgi:precorrin-6Y C5,15-methyltransferase (decarboxylating)
LDALAGGRFDPLSVVLFTAPGPVAAAGRAWGRPESEFAHRNGMITKAEVRAVVLGKLALLPAGILWDVGAGSGSVSSESAALAPGLRIYAVERRSEDIPMLRANLAGREATVVEGVAPEALESLPDPDRVFVGGGGLEVLEAVLHRLRPGGVAVATYASPGRAAEAAARLGNMVQVSVSRAVPIGRDGAVRLAAENPVFVCWGPG